MKDKKARAVITEVRTKMDDIFSKSGIAESGAFNSVTVNNVMGRIHQLEQKLDALLEYFNVEVVHKGMRIIKRK